MDPNNEPEQPPLGSTRPLDPRDVPGRPGQNPQQNPGQQQGNPYPGAQNPGAQNPGAQNQGQQYPGNPYPGNQYPGAGQQQNPYPGSSYPGQAPTQSYPQQPGQQPGQQQSFQVHVPEEEDHTVLRNGLPPVPPPPSSGNRKTLAIVLGSIAAALVVVLVVVFAWLVPALSGNKEPRAVDTASQQSSPESSPEETTSEQPSEEPSPEDSSAPAVSMPAGAVPLPEEWKVYKSPDGAPADGDSTFSRFVTGESSFARLKEWSTDVSLGITKDPESGQEMQRAAAGTNQLDPDGLSVAFSFFAESESQKYGSDPEKIKGLIKQLETKLSGMSSEQLASVVVSHKCASDFRTTKPEIRSFLRGLAVVVGFECKTSKGDAIQGVNLFTITPWGTPQLLGVSGHQSYWDQHPGLMAELANSFRINKWRMP
ncbi:hypothetical protein [Arthrobacter sp.]|uniref:hypothetical protein n=1 Tax=Arthrobacter sp. TaxID=1667 RepID=UPI00258E2374|nr:hypothetical protein [Arthrobacter sp.]